MDIQREALARLIRQHQADIYRYLRYLGAQPAAAEDLVQETFLATLRPSAHHPDPADTAAWSAWLRGIARNLFLAECRRSATTARILNAQALELADASWSAGLARESAWDDHLAALRQCLETLPPRQRGILDHRYVHHTPREEMATLLGIGEDGIKSLLRRIRAALAQCIQERLTATKVP